MADMSKLLQNLWIYDVCESNAAYKIAPGPYPISVKWKPFYL